MLGINKFKRGVLKYPRVLKNLKGQEVTLEKGEHCNLLALTNGVQEFFGLENSTKGLVLLPSSLFANNFKLFQQEV